MRKQVFVFIFSFLFGLILLWGVSRFVNVKKIEISLFTFGWKKWLVMLLFYFSFVLLEAWSWRIILSAQGYHVPYKHFLFPYFIADSVAFFAPVFFWAGEILQGYYFKKNVNVKWADDLISIFIDRFLQLTVNVILFSFGLIFLILNGGNALPLSLAIFLKVIFLLSLLILFFFYFRFLSKESILKIIFKIFGLRRLLATNLGSKSLQIEATIFQFFNRKKKFYQALLVDSLRGLDMIIGVAVLIYFLDKKFILPSSFSILGSTYFASLIPIPASLGTHELIQLFTFHIYGLSKDSSIVFVNVIRIVQGIIALFGLAILLKFSLSSLGLFLKSKIRLFRKSKIKT